MVEPTAPTPPRSQKDLETRRLTSPVARTRKVERLAIACAIASTAVAVVLAVRLLQPQAPPRPSPPPKQAPAPAAAKPPRVLPPSAAVESVAAAGDPTQVVVRFVVPVERALAEATASYRIGPDVKVFSAALAQDGRTVTFRTSPLKEGVTYTLEADRVRALVYESGPVPFRYVGSRRVTRGLVVLYDLEEGEGTVVKDVSGVGDPLNLAITEPDDVKWVAGGLAIVQDTRVVSENAPAKIIEGCRLTNAITIEAWISPANTTQGGPSRIVTLSKNGNVRNFTLGQEGARYDVRLRTTATGENGTNPSFLTRGGATTTLSHVVYTRDATEKATLYINGVAAATGAIQGSLSGWDDTFRFGLANEIEGRRTWLGQIHLVAVYNRALTADEVVTNFKTGPEGNTPKP